MSTRVPIVRAEGVGEKRRFLGGGVHTWKATAEETDGAFFLFEDHVVQGKSTPLHRHPDADETLYVIAGEIRLQIDGHEHTVGRGTVTVTPRGAPHAFLVCSEDARILVLHTPGQTEAFFRDASEPIYDGAGAADVTDPARVQASAQRNGGTEILGPPPFGPIP